MEETVSGLQEKIGEEISERKEIERVSKLRRQAVWRIISAFLVVVAEISAILAAGVVYGSGSKTDIENSSKFAVHLSYVIPITLALFSSIITKEHLSAIGILE